MAFVSSQEEYEDLSQWTISTLSIEEDRMSQEYFAPRTNSSLAAPPKPRRLYQLPDDYTDSAADSPPPVLHVSKFRKSIPNDAYMPSPATASAVRRSSPGNKSGPATGVRRRVMKRPPPLHLSNNQTSETDYSAPSTPPDSPSTSPSPTSPLFGSASNPPPPASIASSTSSSVVNNNRRRRSRPNRSSSGHRSPCGIRGGGGGPPSPMLPAPRSPLATTPRSPLSPLPSPLASPRSPTAASATASSTMYSPPSPQHVGNLARLAQRRRSQAAAANGSSGGGSGGGRARAGRRTSNFLELPVAGYGSQSYGYTAAHGGHQTQDQLHQDQLMQLQRRQQRRYCSLPEAGYNPRGAVRYAAAAEPAADPHGEVDAMMYRLRSFSISPKGALIKHGDQIRSRSSAGSTANTSRTASPRCSSPQVGGHGGGSREASPREHGNSNSFSSEFDEDNAAAKVKYRVSMMGMNETGKTALVSQFLTSEYMNTYDASLDEDFGERNVSVVLDDVESELVFIDHTNGEMSVENTLSTYDPHACVVVYSVTDGNSFALAEDIMSYLERVGYGNGDEEGYGNRAILLAGNKSDLERSRVVSQEEGKNLAISFGAKFIETSAGLQHNVDELLVGVLKQIRLRCGENFKGKKGKHRRKSSKKGNKSSAADAKKPSDAAATMVVPSEEKAAHISGAKSPLKSMISSPIHTLQTVRDILSKACLRATKSGDTSKSCENLYVQ